MVAKVAGKGCGQECMRQDLTKAEIIQSDRAAGLPLVIISENIQNNRNPNAKK